MNIFWKFVYNKYIKLCTLFEKLFFIYSLKNLVQWMYGIVYIFFEKISTFFFRKFQPIASALNNSFLSLDQDTNQFLV